MKPTKALRFLAPMTILAFLLPATSRAQYTRTDLTSNQENAVRAINVNPKLVNAWGLVQLLGPVPSGSATMALDSPLCTQEVACNSD